MASPTTGNGLSSEDAERLLHRAAELDADESVSIQQVRDAAQAAGIRPTAFDAALQEHEAAARSVAHARVAPWWVRTILMGVPGRTAAMVYYWVFFAGIFGVFASTLLSTRYSSGFAIGLIVFLGFSVWTTGRAIQWMDAQGWSSSDGPKEPTPDR